jgi:hypothetical protein
VKDCNENLNPPDINFFDLMDVDPCVRVRAAIFPHLSSSAYQKMIFSRNLSSNRVESVLLLNKAVTIQAHVRPTKWPPEHFETALRGRIKQRITVPTD